jgi:hypothetical protein
MTTDRDVTRIVRSWLEEGVTSVPDRVLDSVLDQLPANPQRRAWWPAWRLRELNTPIRFAVAAAAVAVVAVVGINVLSKNGGGTGGTAPVPSTNPSPTAIPSPAPSVSDLGASDVGRSLGAGTYRVGAPFALPFRITFPSGFTQSHSATVGDAAFGGPSASDGTSYGITVDLIEGVFGDPCHPGTGPTTSPTPLTVDGLVPALTHMVGFEAGPVSDVVVGGHAGKSFRLTNTVDTATAGCTRDLMLPLWTFLGDPSGASTNGGISLEVWVIDVGGTPIVIAADADATTLTADRDQIQSIVDSISFEP